MFGLDSSQDVVVCDDRICITCNIPRQSSILAPETFTERIVAIKETEEPNNLSKGDANKLPSTGQEIKNNELIPKKLQSEISLIIISNVFKVFERLTKQYFRSS